MKKLQISLIAALFIVGLLTIKGCQSVDDPVAPPEPEATDIALKSKSIERPTAIETESQIMASKPDFVAILNSAQTVPPSPDRGKTGRARFWLTNNDTELVYDIQLFDLDLDGWVTKQDATDDVTKIHLHNAPPGVAGPHVLNVLYSPCQDDRDLVTRPFLGAVSGVWDDGDVTDPSNCPGIAPGPASEPLSVVLSELMAGNLYVNVHTTFFSYGELRGQILPNN